MRRGKGQTTQQRRWQYAAERAPAAHDQHQIRGYEQRHWRTDAPDIAAELIQRELGDALQSDQRDADGTECHRRGIGQQADGSGTERCETKSGQHGGGDGHGRSKSGCAFNESAEGKGDEQGLQARVAREAADGILDDFELPGVDGDAIEHDCPEDDPADGEESEGRTVGSGADGEADGHTVHEEGDGKGG